MILGILYFGKIHGVRNDITDFPKLIGEKSAEKIEAYNRCRTGKLLEKNLIELDPPEAVMFSESLFDTLNGTSLNGKNGEDEDEIDGRKHCRPRILEVIDPAQEQLPELILPSHVNEILKKVTTCFSEEGLKQIKRFLGKNRGVATLFYGDSGTGKTLAAYTLAKQLGATVYAVDCSRIRDMWYGETEKNTRRIFREYEKHASQAKVCPILLFNEADQILGSRLTTVSQRTDIAENSIQNILLEEIEKFQGLLVATTNLETQLDSAFDRRFLFKVEFPKPDKDARVRIFESNLKGKPVSRNLNLESLASQYELTGGQIQNVVHSACISAVTRGSKTITIEYLQTACEEQLGSCLQNRQVIGF